MSTNQKCSLADALRTFLFQVAISLTLFAILPTSASFGQVAGVAGISGVVADANGLPIASAQVTMTQTDTNSLHSATTDSGGRYTLPDLPVGSYRLDASASSFKGYTQSGIVLQVGDNAEINVIMQVGSVNEHVEVSAGINMVDTTETAVSQVIDSRRIVGLPLNGRQATQLILLSGASVTPPAQDMIGPKAFYSSVTISVAGGQSGGVNYLLDGGDHNDATMNVNLPFPFPDALQEFSVETSSVPARFGLHPGGVVNAVTKSGTNDWHGNLFEFIRNGDVNARNYFATTRDSLKRNQFGGTFGGRIVTNKLFFFGGYQNTINRSNPPQSVAYTPTQAVLGGDFSVIDSAACIAGGTGKTVIDPTTGKPFPGNMIPQSRLNPQAVNAVQKYIPISTNPCGKVTYGIKANTNESQYIGRVDYVQTPKHTVYFRYFITDYANPAIFDGVDLLQTTKVGNHERAQTGTIGDTFTFSPNVLNSFHASATRIRDNRSAAANDINSGTLGLNVYNASPHFIEFAVNNYFSVGNTTGAPGYFNRNAFSEGDDVDVVRGRHHFGFGAYLSRNQFNSHNGYLENGDWTFDGSLSKDALADYMLGIPASFTQSNPLQNYGRMWVFAIYAQDSIKLSNRLTINVGLRWEPTLPDTDRQGASFTPEGFAAGVRSKVYVNAPLGMLFYGDPGIPKAYYHRHLNNFSPRLGLAWDPHGDGRQTIHLSASILRDTMMMFYPERLTTNAPYSAPISLTAPAGGFTTPYAGYPGGSPFPGQVPPPSTVAFAQEGVYYTMPLYIQPTYTSQWGLAYERQLGPDWLASVTYIGNKTTHIWDATELDPAVYMPGTCNGAPCSTTANTNQRRRFYLENPVAGKAISTVARSDQGGNGNYNGLLASIQHRFAHHYTLLSNYTYSHCINDGDTNTELGGPTYQNPYDRAMDRGSCSFDVRHISNTSIVATSAVSGGVWKMRLLNDWQISPLLSIHSGNVLNVTTGTDNSLTGVGLDRPNAVPGAARYLKAGAKGLLNPKAFSPNPLGTFGTFQHYGAFGPTQVNFDSAVSRIFPLTERFHLEMRVEAFNVINHTNFSPYSNSALALTGITTALNSSTFGKPLGAGDPRIWQAAAELHF